MGKPWTEKLAPSKVAFMNEIVVQVPETNGARAAFVEILQDLADAPSDPKFRFIIAQTDDVQGTNNEALARETSADDTVYVVDIVEMRWLCSEDPDDDSDVTEVML